MQETAQWLGGLDIPSKFLKALGIHGQSALVLVVLLQQPL